jgi:hypothetical protein
MHANEVSVNFAQSANCDLEEESSSMYLRGKHRVRETIKAEAAAA